MTGDSGSASDAPVAHGLSRRKLKGLRFSLQSLRTLPSGNLILLPKSSAQPDGAFLLYIRHEADALRPTFAIFAWKTAFRL